MSLFSWIFGFLDDKICTGVVRSIRPGNCLTTHLESKSTVDSLPQIMRNHFREKYPSTTFTEIRNAVQFSTESQHDFVVSLLSVRQKVLIIANEKDP